MSNQKWIYKHQHVSTILPSLFRKVEACSFVRERFTTYDNDFFDVDKLEGGHSHLVILLHGLEGSSQEHYIQGHAKSFFDSNFDVYAMNYRSCSGEMNNTTRLYHSGETEDIRFLVNQIVDRNQYKTISLVGFSLGANVILKYLGEESENAKNKIHAAVSVSVPMDLRGCSYKLAKGFNRIYSLHFMITLRKKVEHLKSKHDHKALRDINVRKLKTFLDFDDLVTAPLHGFKSGEDYWERASSKQFLHKIKVPTKIINAKNDPFLSESCYPSKEEIGNSNLYFEYPKLGGHVGFVETRLNGQTYIEKESVKFIQEHV